MAQRRPITTHPAFVPAVALWFAALFGLVVAVLPTRFLAGLGLAWLAEGAGRIVLGLAAAIIGAVIGGAIARAIVGRGQADPRPVYEEPEPIVAKSEPAEPARRPLRIREELEAEFGDGQADPEADPMDWRDPAADPTARGMAPGDGFMILTPQPVHPPQPAPDLDALLAQFDNAIAAFRQEDAPAPPPAPPHRFDPVRAFVARQTGGAAPSPLGGAMPDHQAELRAALDKLARAQRDD